MPGGGSRCSSSSTGAARRRTSEERGHPRLRARHFPFSIGGLERDRWLVHMREAIDASDAPEPARARLHEYVTMAADAMRNREESA